MPSAFQLPFSRSAPTQLGRKTYRKHLLPVGTITYDDGTGARPVAFTRDRLQRIARNFMDGATAQVPLVLANDANAHNWDPTRYRGEIKGLEVADDGLYGTIEMSDEGAKLLEDNPNLSVSASVREEPLVRADDGKKFTDVLLHVLGTLNPKLTRLSPAWEPVTLSMSDGQVTVIDLTTASFTDEQGDPPMADLKPEVVDWLNGLSDEERQKLVAPPNGNGHQPTDDTTDEELSDEEEAELAALVAELEASERTEGEPVESSLSNDDRATLDLALAHSEAAQAELAVMRSQVQAAEWAKARADLERSGVPKADLDLAEPALSRPTIDLSVSDGPDLVGIIRGLLESRRGTIDFSGEVHDFGVGGGNSKADALYDAYKASLQKR